MRNKEQMQEVEEQINHRLKRTRKEWRVKSKVVAVDEIEAAKTRISAPKHGVDNGQQDNSY